MTRRPKRDAVPIEPRQRLPVGPGRGPAADPGTLDFGHHAGRTIEELLTVDPDYLEWLSTHPSGARYRAEIDRVLGPMGDLPARAVDDLPG